MSTSRENRGSLKYPVAAVRKGKEEGFDLLLLPPLIRIFWGVIENPRIPSLK